MTREDIDDQRGPEDSHTVVLPRSCPQAFRSVATKIACKQQRGNCI
jgi:hypothetical protein